ncbi:MAG TPA: nicotinamidase [Candidatus Hydrogenedentes bacterium]|nr:nicotinamidase [Candidatus Hydrogenedentota bacterium]
MIEVKRTDALIVVDVQNDFCLGGTLAIPDADLVIRPINSMLMTFDHLVFSRDWHPGDHFCFSDSPEYKDGSWPRHCVQHTPGAEFPSALRVPVDAVIVDKATEPDKEAYSAFDGTDLADNLRARGVTRVFVAGLALDYCVKETVLDALREGFEVVLVKDGARAVAPNQTESVLEELRRAGAQITTSDNVS